MKKILKKINNRRHYCYAKAASVVYGNPTNELFVIGILGSKGKTTTANILYQLLNEQGFKVGLFGTANIIIDGEESLNPLHMTMPGKGKLQKFSKELVEKGIEIAIFEVPSEAQVQYRHVGINFDLLIYTNMTKEIVGAHNFSYEQLLNDNIKVLEYMQKLSKKPRKKKLRDNHLNKLSILKQYIVNSSDSEYKKHEGILDWPTEYYKLDNISSNSFKDLELSKDGSKFVFKDEEYTINMLSALNVYNAIPAIIAADKLGVETKSIKTRLEKIKQIPGRVELIENARGLTIVVDYAHEPVGLEGLLKDLSVIKDKGRLLCTISAQGGGRDKKKRPILAEITAKYCDYAIITDDDPYDEPSSVINKDIEKGFISSGYMQYEIINSRKEAIAKLISKARKGDILAITAKGADQIMLKSGKEIPWDDREVVKDILNDV